MGNKLSQSPQNDIPKPARAKKGAEPTRAHPRAESERHGQGLRGVGSALPDDAPFTRENILLLQRTIGNRAVSGLIQAKLKVSQTGDEHEREADQVAEQVMRMPETGRREGLQRQTTEQRERPEDETVQLKAADVLSRPKLEEDDERKKRTEEGPPVQAKEQAGKTPSVPSNVESQVASMRGGGEPLPDAARAFFEPRFGQDLSRVRVHQGGRAADSARALEARAYTSGHDIVFGAGEYSPETSEGKRLLAHELTHVMQQCGNNSIQRKKGGGETDTSSTSKSDVGMAKGESKTPSDQDKMASGYKERADGNVDTADGRVVSREQALAESQVINSEGIFMGAYLARYNALKGKHSLPQNLLDDLSGKAGFMKQFKTGDIVLRQMNAEDSRALATVTDSNYSHSGIVQVNGGRVWVLDSYPTSLKTAGPGDRSESTVLIRFEDFFSDQHGEQIVQGLVLRITAMTNPIQANVNALIDHYNVTPTSFDYQFKVDNDQYSLYCSELVWRILQEASSTVLPPNEFEFTKNTVISLISQLEALIALQKSQGTDASQSEKQLGMLKSKLQEFEAAATKELYSPGSLERTPGLDPVTGFTREGNIEGEFEVVIVSGTAPADSWDTPDSYVALVGGLFGASGKTSTKDDTTTPTWNETLVKLDYESLRSVTLSLYDEDPISSDDQIAVFTGDLRPVNPKGQTFTLSSAGATLTVMVRGVEEGKAKGAFGPQAPRKDAAP